MNTRRLRLARPKWTLGTMLLVVGWSAVVVWLNVRPRTCTLAECPMMVRSTREPVPIYYVEHGYPWICVSGNWLIMRPDLMPLHPRSEHQIHHPSLAPT